MVPLIFVLLLPAGALAQPATTKRTAVDRIFAGFNTHTPGCAVGVAHQGQVELTAGYGMADLERNVAITASTVFESGSVAKQFAAAALLLLARKGKISCNASRYLQPFVSHSARRSRHDLFLFNTGSVGTARSGQGRASRRGESVPLTARTVPDNRIRGKDRANSWDAICSHRGQIA